MIPIKKALLAGGLVATTLTGGAIGASLLGTAGAAETTTTTGADPSNTPAMPQGPHRANGVTEAPLTGDVYDKAVAAAKKAQPDATVVRAETDAEGDVYEVHMTKSDGSPITVKLDKDFNVTSTEDGPGCGFRHGGPGAPQSSTSTSDAQA